MSVQSGHAPSEHLPVTSGGAALQIASPTAGNVASGPFECEDSESNNVVAAHEGSEPSKHKRSRAQEGKTHPLRHLWWPEVAVGMPGGCGEDIDPDPNSQRWGHGEASL